MLPSSHPSVAGIRASIELNRSATKKGPKRVRFAPHKLASTVPAGVCVCVWCCASLRGWHQRAVVQIRGPHTWTWMSMCTALDSSPVERGMGDVEGGECKMSHLFHVPVHIHVHAHP